jgi:hypothetical protein
MSSISHCDVDDGRDVMGQERFGHLTRCYYKGAAGAFIAFDITSGSSFASVLKWKEDLDNVRSAPYHAHKELDAHAHFHACMCVCVRACRVRVLRTQW